MRLLLGQFLVARLLRSRLLLLRLRLMLEPFAELLEVALDLIAELLPLAAFRFERLSLLVKIGGGFRSGAIA